MNSVILCEGSTDYTLLQYYMRKANGWNDKKDMQKDVFRLQDQRSRIFFKEDSFLTIAATGGCSMMSHGLESVLKKNYFAAPNVAEQRFDSVVIITDRDEVSTESEFIKKITKVFENNHVFHDEVKNNQWLKCKMENSVGNSIEFRFLLLIIPFEENGAMETFLLQAVAKENAYDRAIIEQCNNFVDNIDSEKRYLANRRYITKAKFDTYFSIRTPAHQFNERQNILKNVQWENYKLLQKEFELLGDL